MYIYIHIIALFRLQKDHYNVKSKVKNITTHILNFKSKVKNITTLGRN